MSLGTSREVARARAAFLAGHIEADEFEQRLDALTAVDPAHVGELGDPIPDWECFAPDVWADIQAAKEGRWNPSPADVMQLYSQIQSQVRFTDGGITDELTALYQKACTR